MTIIEKIAMLRQMRYIAAMKATGGRNDIATTELIRFDQAIAALEAVASEGAPELVLKSDIDGHPLDPNSPWNTHESEVRAEIDKNMYERLAELNRG